MQFISKDKIKIDRVLSDLDIFAIDFVKSLSKHTPYSIVSGYVSILLGRARASEDIDIIIPKMDFRRFLHLLKDLKKNKFYCLNADDDKAVYDYICNNFAIRFAKKNTAIPNIELKFAKNKFDRISIGSTVTVEINNKKIVICNLEMQIAFKEVVLKSPKDIEDARHIRNIAVNYLNDRKLKQYREMLHGFQ
ncbi:hypothetical protein HYX08_01360 [Candidatus Woesearchaeota archaeon]|nr:hypothetical protein [Candidatus Woesearchaeota archaeon]